MNYTIKSVRAPGPAPILVRDMAPGTFFRATGRKLYLRTDTGFVRMEQVGRSWEPGSTDGGLGVGQGNDGFCGTPVDVTIQVHDGGSR